MTQSLCERCGDWWEPEDHHDYSHRDDRIVGALERIAGALEMASAPTPQETTAPEEARLGEAKYSKEQLDRVVQVWDGWEADS